MDSTLAITVSDGVLVSNAIALVIGLIVGYWVAYLQFAVRRLKKEQEVTQEHINQIDREIHDEGHQGSGEEG